MRTATIGPSESTSAVDTFAPGEPWGIAHSGRFAYIEERLGLGGGYPSVEQRVRRAIFYAFLTWCVPFGLSFVSAQRPLVMPFASDLEAHARGLVAVPLLVLAEWPIERRVRSFIRRIGSPPLMRSSGRAVLVRHVRAVRRLGGHPVAEGALVLLACAAGYEWLVRHEIGMATWISTPRGGVEEVTAAGAWAAAVTVPLFSFLLLRWVWRWAVLGVLFWRVAHTRLRLVACHKDHVAGIAFLSELGLSFSWVVMAASSVVSAKWLDAILYAGVAPRTFTSSIYAACVCGVVIAFLPLVAFVPRLIWTGRHARRLYDSVVARHGIFVESHWLPGHEVTADDAGSMADLNSVYEAVATMRVIPIRPRHILTVAAATVVPMLPVIAHIVPLPEIAQRLLASLL